MVNKMKKKIKKIQQEINNYQNEGLSTTSLELDLSILEKRYQPKVEGYQRVELARNVTRPTSLEFINEIFDGFVEMHGDRLFGDDKSIIGGVAFLKNMPVTVIGVQKGKDATENIKYNFGMPHPEGYRKALRLMKQANKFKRPIITLINTPGAYPGLEAEKRGQNLAIAQNLVGMMELEVPVISIIIGEGGSGGALALGVGNQVWMLENSIYSILSPEGFASILYKDASKASEVVPLMKITSDVLLEMSIIDHVISETENGINEGFSEICVDIRESLYKEISHMKHQKPAQIKKQRYNRFRDFV